MRRTALAVAIAAAAALSVAAPLAAQSGGPGEYEVKGAFLLNFARLVEWPASALGEPQQPFAVGVVGEEDVVRAVEKQMGGRSIGTHPIRVERISTPQQAPGCQVLFVSASGAARGDEMIRATRGTSVLTVGDVEGFARRGGIIDFFSKKQKIHFAINRQAAEEAGLRISSRLLRLAKLVSSEGDQP